MLTMVLMHQGLSEISAPVMSFAVQRHGSAHRFSQFLYLAFGQQVDITALTDLGLRKGVLVDAAVKDAEFNGLQHFGLGSNLWRYDGGRHMTRAR
ncbi:hypothetical protein A9Q94_10175 [Rhodobacterales bacterium 56_14_T64]|nr:hypothetical protein A9Q94_10175 [Rhodobacterales bacterium 56_14_T64]